MTDKEIIINIDRCKYRDKYTNFCLAEKDDIGETYTICTGTDCYFKQLARKTAECGRSQKRISDLEERIINHSKEIEEYCIRLADKNKKCEKYEQALEEIEIYCNVIKQTTCNFENCNKNDAAFIKRLLDIISKAKDGKNE